MFRNLIDLLFPKVCAGCKALLLQNEKVICTACRHEIPLTGFHRQHENEARLKFYGRIPVEHVSAFMYYHKKGIVRELIHSLKYRGHQEIGTVIGEWYAVELQKTLNTIAIDSIIPVPLHKKKLHERGYNQVTSFSEALSTILNIPVDHALLIRKTYSKTQSQKSLFLRTEVDTNIFEALYNEDHRNKHFLLIDDVLTTGSTLESCARALLKIPGAKISIITMAISHS